MDSVIVRAAESADLLEVMNFLQPFMDQEFILPRTSVEMELLLRYAFLATAEGKVVGFAAVEIYSKKLAEIQCLCVSEKCRRMGIGRQLVSRCVERAKSEKVREVMAITATEQLFQDCGFDYALPGQKRALFVQTNGN
jgi:amino-acid N-acetyltransferase